MTFKDIFKNSFLNGFTAGVDSKMVVVSLIITLILATYIFFVYRLVTRKTFYDDNFNVSLIAMAVITAAIILTIQSNIVLSLGMVGALSIVRFRTAVKDSLDLAFLYWAISIGIICGAGLSLIAVVASMALTIVILAVKRYPKKSLTLILVVNSTVAESDDAIIETVKKHTRYHKIKSHNLTTSTLDMVIEVKLDKSQPLLHELLKIDGVTSASVLSHDGDITA